MRYLGLFFPAALVAGLLVGNAAHAALVTTGEGMIEGKPVSAYAKFEIVGGNLQITLVNTGTRSDYAMAHVLTDVSFQMDGVDFYDTKPSGVAVADGSYLSFKDGRKEFAGFDVSSEWGLARNVMLVDAQGQPLGPFDFAVTATSPLYEQHADPFEDSNLGGAPKLDGADFGLINEASRYHDGIANKDIIVNAVVITLVPKGDALVEADLGRISEVTYSFGSDHVGIVGLPDNVIPEPGSLIVWCLLAPLAIAWRRRDRKR